MSKKSANPVDRPEDAIPELTAKRARESVRVGDIPALAHLVGKRGRGERGPQKTPTKERVTMRLDRVVVDHYRAMGDGWQTKLNADLVEVVKRGEKARA